MTDLSLDGPQCNARQAIGEMAEASYAGGSDDERLVRNNVDAQARWQFHPRVLAGPADVSCSTSVLSYPLALPVAIAPTARAGLAHREGLAHPEGEVATARGAADVGAVAMALRGVGSVPVIDQNLVRRAPGWPLDSQRR